MTAAEEEKQNDLFETTCDVKKNSKKMRVSQKSSLRHPISVYAKTKIKDIYWGDVRFMRIYNVKAESLVSIGFNLLRCNQF